MMTEDEKIINALFIDVMAGVSNYTTDARARMALYRRIGVELIDMASDMGAELNES